MWQHENLEDIHFSAHDKQRVLLTTIKRDFRLNWKFTKFSNLRFKLISMQKLKILWFLARDIHLRSLLLSVAFKVGDFS